MKLVHGTQIKKALHSVKPQCIAVAYVGGDWESFVDIRKLKEIVVSPTAGSSADAILEIVDRLGWDNVHFLDELHAKLYIGKTSGAIGSFNLSANGLSGHILHEAGYIVDDSVQLKSLQALYADLKARATVQYDSQPKKERQLSKLREMNARLREAGLERQPSSRSRTLAEYMPLTESDFYCAFYMSEGLEYDVQAFRKHNPARFASHDTDPGDVIKENLPFLPRDRILSGHWLLMWKAWADDPVPPRLEVEWMYINDVIPNAVIDVEDGYTKLAVQWKGARGIGSPPFRLGPAEKRALRALLASGSFPEFFPNASGKSWSLNRTFPRFKEFVLEWKRQIAQ